MKTKIVYSAEIQRLRDEADRTNARDRRNAAFASVAETIAREWYRLCVRSGCQTFRLWYRRARDGEKMAIPLVSIQCPADGYEPSIELSISWNTVQAARHILEAMNTLPILGPVPF